MKKKSLLDLAGTNMEEIHDIQKNIHDFYLSYPIKKADKRKLRWIDAPLGRLKEIQYNILYNIIYNFTPHKAAVGFRVGMGVHTGAERHLNNKVILTMDIENFFNSVKIPYLYRMIMGMSHRLVKRGIIQEITPDNTHAEIDYGNMAHTIAYLCSYKGQLPQGAPTSPALANLFASKLDGVLQRFADKEGMVYTRYADDITLSHPDVNFNIGNYITPIEETLAHAALRPNYKKTRILRPHRRMVVTGVVINDKLGVPKYKWRNLRARIHNIKRDYNTISVKEYQEIRGYCEWIKVLNPKRGKQLINQLCKIPLQTS